MVWLPNGQRILKMQTQTCPTDTDAIAYTVFAYCAPTWHHSCVQQFPSRQWVCSASPRRTCTRFWLQLLTSYNTQQIWRWE